jgi:flagellar biosynthesis/type III secretory pathway chaperone
MNTNVLEFLSQLLESQDSMLAVLHKKQAILAKPEKEAIASLAAEEEAALKKMQKVLQGREALLTAARLQNIPSDSIEQLCGHFFPHNANVQKLLEEAKHRTHQIGLLAYTNWTMSRKSLIHVSQILELLETRGQGKTTYQPQTTRDISRGRLVDHVA